MRQAVKRTDKIRADKIELLRSAFETTDEAIVDGI